MIKLFVFDLGGVILPFEHSQIAYKMHERSALKDHITPDDVFDFLFNNDYGFVNAYEEGKISSIEFFEYLKNKFRLRLAFEEFKEIWNPIFREDEEVKKIIEILKSKGYPLFLLSNTNELHFSYIKERFPIVELMDRWILSYEVGAKKPKKAIYNAIFDNVHFSPQEILYIDDIPKYVEAASSLGIRGVLFTGANSLREIIITNGINLE